MSDKAKEVINAINKFNYDTAIIVIMHPSDIQEIYDKDRLYSKFAHAHFIPNAALKRGEAIVLKDDSELKRQMYDSIKEQKERKWRLKKLEGAKE